LSKAKEFIDFWVENSIHAREPYGAAGAEQGVEELARRLLAAAGDQGISEAALVKEVGDVAAYLRAKVQAANTTEDDRRDRGKPK
jgi:hypothetical protein